MSAVPRPHGIEHGRSRAACVGFRDGQYRDPAAGGHSRPSGPTGFGRQPGAGVAAGFGGLVRGWTVLHTCGRDVAPWASMPVRVRCRCRSTRQELPLPPPPELPGGPGATVTVPATAQPTAPRVGCVRGRADRRVHAPARPWLPRRREQRGPAGPAVTTQPAPCRWGVAANWNAAMIVGRGNGRPCRRRAGAPAGGRGVALGSVPAGQAPSPRCLRSGDRGYAQAVRRGTDELEAAAARQSWGPTGPSPRPVRTASARRERRGERALARW